MITRKISQVPEPVGSHAGSRRTVTMQVLLSLVLCVLVGGTAPAAAALHGNGNIPPQRLYAREADGIWFSDDAEISWTQAGPLPSQPLAMAVARGTPGLLYVGTQSDGLLTSSDGGVSWQQIDNTALAGGFSAALAVTALAIDPEDERIVYAATEMWLGTYAARFAPLGVAVSVDGGRQWLQLSRAQPGDTPVWRLSPVAGQPLSVVTVNGTGGPTASLELSPELLGLLQDGTPAVRASAARAIGLLGQPAALPGLMQALADTDALAGQRIAEAIGRIGDRSVSVDLLSLLASAPAAVRTRAALALGLLGSAEAVPGLAALLSAGDPEAQRVSAEALAAIGTPAALAALMAPLADQQLTSARHAAMGGLELAGQPAVAALVAALNDSSAVVRANAAGMLGWLKPANAVADLALLLTDPDPAVQAEAAWALGEINTEPARLALIPAPNPVAILAPNPAPILALNPAAILAPAPLDVLPAAIADAWPAVGTLAMLGVLLLLAMLAAMLILKGPREPAAPVGA